MIHSYYFPAVGNNWTALDKRGACASGCDFCAIATLGLHSLRCWSLWHGGYSNCEVLPCVWGEIAAQVVIAGGPGAVSDASIVLGFNEPDMPDQSDLTPAQAVPLWHGVRNVLSSRVLASPAPCQDVGWLPEFLDEYEAAYPSDPVPFDIFDVHLYWDDLGLCQFVAEQYIQMAAFYGVSRVIVSEFAFGHLHGPAQGISDAAEFIAWMNAQDAIERYYWFATRLVGDEWWLPDGWQATGLMEPAACTTLTRYGEVYRDA